MIRAKAIVIGVTTFVVGLVASLSAIFLTQPVLRSNWFGPPADSIPSLTDGPVLRVVIGAALNLAHVATFALGLGTIMRRSVGAIATGIASSSPSFFAGSLPLSIEQWLIRTTPAAGLSILQTIERDHDTAVEEWSMADPWVGLGVLGAYAAVGLAVGFWQLRRRDA